MDSLMTHWMWAEQQGAFDRARKILIEELEGKYSIGKHPLRIKNLQEQIQEGQDDQGGV